MTGRHKENKRSITQIRGWSTTALSFECSHNSDARRKGGLPDTQMHFADQQKSPLATNYRSTNRALPFPWVVGGEWSYILHVFSSIYKKIFLTLLPSKFENVCLKWYSTYQLWENILGSQPQIVALKCNYTRYACRGYLQTQACPLIIRIREAPSKEGHFLWPSQPWAALD